MTDSLEILLVEDNPQDAELALLALRQRDLADHLVHVRDGQEALDFLFGTGPHAERDVFLQPKVVVLDLKLPKVEGLEVLRRIRADERTRTLPVAVFTSSLEESDVHETYRLGANSYTVKPVEFESFCAAICGLGQYWLRLNTLPHREP
jgi:CheY-like chemotaxis protein